MNGTSRWAPWLAATAAAAYLLFGMIPPSERGMELSEFGKIPIVYQGRCKPFDTFARTALLSISGRQDYSDQAGRRRPAIQWVLDVITDSAGEESRARRHKVIRIENDQVLNILGLPERPGSYRYSFEEIGPKIELISKEAQRAASVEKGHRTLFDEKILELYQKLQLHVLIERAAIPHLIPPGGAGEEWKPAGEARPDAPALEAYRRMFLAYHAGREEEFNRELRAYLEFVRGRLPAEARSARMETWFNRFEPFYRGILLYGAAFLLGVLAWMVRPEPLRRAAFAVVAVTVVLHTAALILRMYLQGRPPVTNLYSSAIFIGWGCVLTGMVLERLYRNGIGTVVASMIGFLTLIVAHNLATGDTMEMLQAVLDTNFWLATHVTSVTIGYSATFIAGFLAVLYIVRGVFTRSLDREAARTLGRMIYGVVCFATLFSFVGTVLGGIWADQSWGRFWGWDPKENGALIIVLWNALILHARWGALVQHRGLAVLSVFGNVVTAWSWFGVNMLGVGLHSYGFMSSAEYWLYAFVASQLAIIGLGLIPTRGWRSGSLTAG
jgi:ABC-type transport system involved in cytochrome c biogenesis permease subunit